MTETEKEMQDMRRENERLKFRNELLIRHLAMAQNAHEKISAQRDSLAEHLKSALTARPN